MNQINWMRHAALAGLLLVLGAAALWIEFKHRPEKAAREEQAKKVFALKEAQIEAIGLHDGTKTVEFVCTDLSKKLCRPGDNAKWELAAPLKVKADESNVNSLVSSLSFLVPSETISLQEETPEKRAALLKDYGLDPQTRNAPATKRIEVRTQGKGSTVLYLGQPHPIGEGLFALSGSGEGSPQANENQVYVIPNHFKANLEHDLTYWRDKKLLTLTSHDIGAFELESGKSRIKGVRKDGQWTLTTGKEELAGDIENIDSLLSGATFLTARDFPSNDKTDTRSRALLKGARPVLTLTLQKNTGTGDAPLVLKLFTAKGPKLYATLSNLDPLFELELATQNRLRKDVKDLRLSKLITTMERFSAKRLEFSGKPLGSPPLVLINTDAKWTLTDKTEVDADKVQGTLDKLSGNRIKEFLPAKSIPKGQEEGLKLTLGDDKAQDKRQLLFWKRDGKLYARDLLSQRNEAFLVDSAVQEGLPWDRNYFKKAPPAGKK
ncbi:MAG: DUF4340 domain-containing protein [Oligoflexia bacterium]|nr:DUF4340 domain-containing protein [Oligoflexia bacterium]